MKLIYNVEDRPPFGKTVVFAIQQLLAIMTATLVVPVIINSNSSVIAAGMEPQMSPAAALFGAGIGTIVYLLFTKFKSPVFLGSSFAFIGPMLAAFLGAATVGVGYIGLIIGAVFAGLVYVIISVIVKLAGAGWVSKLMPAAIIGPTVALIGFSLAGNAVGDLQSGYKVYNNITTTVTNAAGVTTTTVDSVGSSVADYRIAILVGLVTLVVTCVCSIYGKKNARMIPFIIGIASGYAFAAILTVIGNAADIDWLKLIDFSVFGREMLTDGKVTLTTFLSIPSFSFTKTFGSFGQISWSYIGTIAVAYVPVAFVVFAEHIADHKNISSIIERDLVEGEPGLSRTLLGDGIGSMAGAILGGCPNTTYGESVGCVAISGNASVITILFTAIGALIVAFLTPFVAFVDSIPPCVMGGVCMALYGFIAVSGLKMVQKVDLEDNRNLFVVSTILVSGIGGLAISFGKITITTIAVALILGILMNLILSGKKKDDKVK